MELIQQFVPYFFPTLVALEILYFFMSFGEVKHSADYTKIDKGKKGMFGALAAMCITLALWAIVYSLVAAIG